MMNNRKVINELNKKIELLKKDLESKENTVINVLDANKELSQHNNFLENRIGILKLANKDLLKDLEKKESIIRELNVRLSKSDGKLDKIKNMYRLLTGEELE